MPRPSKVTPEVRDRFCQGILLGMTYRLACQFAGVSEAWFYQLKAEARDLPDDDPKSEFMEAVKGAEAQHAARALATIQRASQTQWQAGAWMLERRHGYRKDLDVNVQLSAGDLGEAPDLTTPEGRATMAEALAELPAGVLAAALARQEADDDG